MFPLFYETYFMKHRFLASLLVYITIFFVKKYQNIVVIIILFFFPTFANDKTISPAVFLEEFVKATTFSGRMTNGKITLRRCSNYV